MVVIALRGDVHDRLLVRVCVLVVAVAIAGVVWLREAPAALYADDDGITVRNPDRTVRLRWQDISDFYVAPWHGRAQYAWVRTVSGDDIPVRGLGERQPLGTERPHRVEQAVAELNARRRAIDDTYTSEDLPPPPVFR